MKELLIKIQIDGDKIQTVCKRNGFTDDASGILEVIGILDNLKNLELDKLKKHANIKLPLKDNSEEDKGYHFI